MARSLSAEYPRSIQRTTRCCNVEETLLPADYQAYDQAKMVALHNYLNGSLRTQLHSPAANG